MGSTVRGATCAYVVHSVAAWRYVNVLGLSAELAAGQGCRGLTAAVCADDKADPRSNFSRDWDVDNDNVAPAKEAGAQVCPCSLLQSSRRLDSCNVE